MTKPIYRAQRSFEINSFLPERYPHTTNIIFILFLCFVSFFFIIIIFILSLFIIFNSFGYLQHKLRLWSIIRFFSFLLCISPNTCVLTRARFTFFFFANFYYRRRIMKGKEKIIEKSKKKKSTLAIFF